MGHRNAALPGAKVRRFAVEVGGYSWMVHGGMREGQFEAHLVELRGAIRFDAELDQPLRQKMREAIAEFLNRKVSEVKPVRADLFLMR